jgi:phosphinothricin acetyltransferase
MSDSPVDGLLVRAARETDAAPLLEIYRPFVEETAVSFETVTPAVDDFAARIRKALEGWQWLVAEADGHCVGYAYGSTHRERAAYRWSVEVSAYVAPSHRGRGLGKRLYTQLLEELAARGYCNAYGGITLPNDASMALHRSVGFEPVGVFRSVGRKFDRWHDVAWLHKRIRAEPL